MIEVYCDESRPEVIYGEKKEDRYMVLGGVWVPYGYREEVKDSIKFLKNRHDVHGEIKWNNVSPSKIDFYTDLIDLFFDQPIRFRCIVVDGWKVDIEQYHDSDNELGFYKFYYQLLMHWINPKESYWIYLDYKKNKLSNRLHTLENVLSNATLGEICDVQAIESKQSLLIQLADVLIGAVGYRYHEINKSRAKLTTIKIIEQHLGHRIQKTAKSERKFNVFEIGLRG